MTSQFLRQMGEVTKAPISPTYHLRVPLPDRPALGRPPATRHPFAHRLRLPLRAVAASALLALASLWISSPTSTLPVPRTPAARAEVRPNIVFVLTDDLSMNLLPYMPHVRELQRDGTTMSKYYAVDSLCCPSRTAIFTGQYPHDNGVFTNTGADGGYAAYQANDDQDRSFAVALKHAGYRTGFMGKYLNGYLPTDPVPPGWDSWQAVGMGYREFDYDLSADGRIEHYGHEPQDYLTDVLSEKSGRFIDRAARDKKPFMLEVATFAPHKPYTPPPRYAAAYPGLTYPRTPAFGQVPADPPAWLSRRAPLTPAEESSIDRDFRKRVQADLAVDDLVAHLESVLRARGLADNTYFVFSSDNGYHMGESRLLSGKQTAFDTDIHVPLVVRGPGVPRGKVVDRLASNIDLAPTFESLAGATTQPSVDGVSLLPLWRGLTENPWQQAVLVEHHRPVPSAGDPDRQSPTSGIPPTYQAVRTATALYVRYADGTQEYYDTATDPYELHNLAASGVPPGLVLTLDALTACHGAAQCQRASR
jgi:N-acetylglucosamine-6-sulfatase